MRGLRGIGLLLAALLLMATALPALAEKKVALVIGNSTYKSVAALTNPRNDAADVATALRDLGFEVIERIDVEKNAIRPLLKDFSRRVTDADTALVYYAGHALQYQGHYYLVPVDADFEDPGALKYDMLATDDIREVMDRVPGVRIMIYDACRNDPFKDDPDATPPATPPRGLTRGLTRVVQVHGSVTAYATAPLDVAEDGSKRNSPFTRSLLKWIREPGLDINQMFMRVRNDVYKETNQRQLPEITISLLEDYYLNKVETDRSLWAKIRYSDDPAVLKDFLSRFPNSDIVPDARYRLEVIERGRKVIEDFRRQEAQHAKDEQDRIARDAEVQRQKAIAEEQQRQHDAEVARQKAAAEEQQRQREAEAARLKAEADAQLRQRQARDAACTADAALIDKYQAEGSLADLASLRSGQSLCPDTPAKIDAAVAKLNAIEAQKAREVACTAEVANVAQLLAQSRGDELTAMRARPGLCPETTAHIDSALAQIAAAAQALAAQKARDAACVNDQAAIAKASGQGKAEDLTKLRAKQTLCPDTPARIDAALAEIAAQKEATQKAREAACASDAATIAQLLTQNRGDELTKMRGKASLCPETPAKLEAAIAEATAASQQLAIQKARETACANDATAIAQFLAQNRSDELTKMRAKPTQCLDTSVKIDAALVQLAAAAAAAKAAQQKARDAACSADATAISQLQTEGRGDELTKMRAAATACPETPAKIDAALAALAAAEQARQKFEAGCRQEAAQIVDWTGSGNTTALNQLKSASHCPDTAGNVEKSLATIAARVEADRQRAVEARAAQCASEADHVKAAAASADLTSLNAIKTTALCQPDTGTLATAAIDQLIAQQSQICGTEMAQLLALDQTHADDIAALGASAKCPDVAKKATGLVQQLREAQASAAECDREKQELDRINGLGEPGRDALKQLSGSMTCASLKPTVLALLGPTTPEPPAEPTQPIKVPVIDSPDQIKRAQKSLKRLGCFTGATDEPEASKAHEALKAYFKEKGEGSKPTSIDDTILARLEAEPDDRICPLVCPDGEHDHRGKCVADQKKEPEKPRTREKPVAQAEKPAPAPAPAAPVAAKPKKGLICVGC